jgi:hypothetical protein
MPNRMVREGLLDSARYWAVTIKARLLYLHLLLLADDLGCVSLAPVFLRRRCFDDKPTEEQVARLLRELADADLIRPYDAEGARYAFIPRFRQRLQRTTLRHPAPPMSLLIGDPDAQEKFQKISDVSGNSTAGQPSATVDQPSATVPQPPEVKRREEKKSVSTTNVVLSSGDPEGSPERSVCSGVPDCPAAMIVEAYHQVLPTLPRIRILTPVRRTALRARWREMAAMGKFGTEAEGVEWFRRFFAHVGESEFLRGDTAPRNGSSPWQADLEWLIKPGNFVKVLEGRYHG